MKFENSAIPLIDPGRRAIKAAIEAGESVPQFHYLPESVAIRSDGGLDIVEGSDDLPDQLLIAIGQVNQAVAAREQAVQPQS